MKRLISKFRITGIACLFLIVFSFQAEAFPGESFNRFVLIHGNPSNWGKETADYLEKERLVHYYWMGTEADPLMLGKKMKGNLVVIFENKNKGDIPIVNGAQTAYLKSQQETFLSRITNAEFNLLLETLKGAWITRSKVHHENVNRSYDLYQLTSSDHRYQAEMSYSLMEEIKPFSSNEANLPAPLFNLWIHISPK